ncbi:type II CAAX endopeptidase family protein [Haloechinothrix salitolerans]|uniref:Type II CAAX endopeptidase family protein n=1 Tax=Haloechinothrix salitolerans TaxID=926830 RepID=A0ABW2C694_9PSEU
MSHRGEPGGQEDAALPSGSSESSRARLVFGAHWALLAFLIGLGGYHLLNVVFAVILPGTAENDFGSAVVLAFVPTVALAGGPVIGSLLWGEGLPRDFHPLPNRHDLRVGLFCGSAALVVAYGLTWLLRPVYGDRELSDAPLRDVLSGLHGSTVVLITVAVIMVLAAPLAEELLMRGALWRALAHYRVPPWAVLVVTSVLFAYLHTDSSRTLVLVGQGLAFGAARLITGRVGASVVAHAVNNTPPAALILVGAW